MESELSATEKITNGSEQEKLLGVKRSSRSLRDNYLFRRLLSGKLLGKYEKLADSCFHMMSFNWEEERLVKMKSNMMGNLNAMALWFYLCSNYFPYCSNQFLDKPSAIPENLNRILEKIISNKRDLKKKSNLNSKNKYIDDMHSLISAEIELNEEEICQNADYGDNVENKEKDLLDMSTDKMVEILDDKLNKLTEKNNSLLTTLIKNVYTEVSTEDLNKQRHFLCSYENIFNYSPEDVLVDMQYQNPYTEEFKKYLIRKNEEKASQNLNQTISEEGKHKSKKTYNKAYKSNNSQYILSRAEEEMNCNPDDIVCVVCNDGDYEDNDLIVYCSSCQMTVHQSCYGIVTLPKDDWICYPCLAFGKEKGKERDCLLCPVKGGAMKPCNIKKAGQFFAFVMSLRGEMIKENDTLAGDKSFVHNINPNIISFNFSDIEMETPKADEDVNIGVNPEIHPEIHPEIYSEDNANHNEGLFQTDPVQEEAENNNIVENKDNTFQSDKSITLNSVKSSKLSKTLNSITPQDSMITPNIEKKDLETNKQTIISSSSPKKRGRRRKIGKSGKKNKTKSETVELVNSFNEFINPKVANENAWAHLSCALWLPEVIIENYPKKEIIKNIENMDKKRFTETCSICKLINYGPTIKCENEKCSLRFHVECARINKYLLEKVNNYSGNLKFYICCQIHRPHKLIKNMELCRQRTIDDIVHFSEMLNKNYDILSKLDRRNDFSVFTPRRYGLHDTEKKNKQYSNFFSTAYDKSDTKESSKDFVERRDKAKILKAVREMAISMSNLNLKVERKAPKVEEKRNTAEIPAGNTKMPLYEISHKKDKIKIRYQDTLSPYTFPWYLIKETTNVNQTPYQIFLIYSKELVPNEEEFYKLILKRPFNSVNKEEFRDGVTNKGRGKAKGSKGSNAGKKKLTGSNMDVDDTVKLYCYCEQPFIDGHFMISCFYGSDDETLNNCIHNGWVHQDCVEELQKYTREELSSETFQWACKECIEKNGPIDD